MALADYQALVDDTVRAPSDGLVAGSRDKAIELARLRYSVDAPRELVEDIAWMADGYFGPLPEGWLTGSYLLDAEFPIGEQPASTIDLQIYMEPADQKLVTPDGLQAGDIVRVRYAAPHELVAGDTPTDTIPDVHREAVASYAAHILFKQLAANFSGERETPINADRADTESRARNFAQRAKEARAAYFSGIGKADPQGDKGASSGSGAQPAASVSSLGGRTRASLTRGSLAL